MSDPYTVRQLPLTYITGKEPRHLRPGRVAAVCFLAAALLLVAQAGRCDEVARDLVVLSLAASVDLASTHYALARCATCREANPAAVAVGPVAVKAAGIAATAWGCEQLRRRGHPRGAKWLRWGVAGVWGGAAAWNLHKGRTAR